MNITVFIDKYGKVVEHFVQAAEQIPADNGMFKPSEKSLPWVYMLSHLPTHWTMFMKVLEDEPNHGFPGVYRAEMPDGPAGLASMYRDKWKVFADYLRSKPESFIMNTYSPPWGGPDETVDSLLDWLLEEAYHHRGQAWVYARINDIKPPSIWGTEPA